MREGRPCGSSRGTRARAHLSGVCGLRPAVLAALAAFSVSSGAATATAQPTQTVGESIAATSYPTAFVARPINLRGGMIRVDARYQHLAISSVATNQVAVGAAVGITDSIEIGVSHTRLAGSDYYNEGAVVANFANGGHSYGDVAIYGRYGFMDAGDFKLSAEIAAIVPVYASSDWQFSFALPVRARLANAFALDLMPELRLGFGENSTGGRDTHLSLNIPVAGVLQVADQVWIAGRSGMFWRDFALDSFYFPLLLEAGYTVSHAGKAVLDLSVQGGFPQFIMPGANDALVTDLWVLRVNLQAYLGH